MAKHPPAVQNNIPDVELYVEDEEEEEECVSLISWCHPNFKALCLCLVVGGINTGQGVV